ncbi:MAG TPA: AAA family ATPase, partial [Blastocatellia bacterium]|nr:AAA family ATPase [Blastocatellia bacterium]
MKVTRIGKIRGHRLFRDFAWPADLEPFAQFNLIYGWNGSGKTTLSSLFRHLETRSAVAEGDVEFEIDSVIVAGNTLATARVPAVRVFNRDVIASTIFATGQQMDPIYYLGEDSVEKQKQVEVLKSNRDRAEAGVSTARTEKSNADKALDDFCINQARVIKSLLIGSRSTDYANYNKRTFKQAIEDLTTASALSALLPAEEKEKLRRQKDAQPKDTVTALAVAVPDFESLRREVDDLLKRSVVSLVIGELVEDSEVSIWVQRGLALHSGDRKIDKCRFCDQTLPASRVQELEAYFNDAFTNIQSEVTDLARRVEIQRVLLAGVQFPDSSRLYDHLVSELQAAVPQARRLLDDGAAFLAALHGALLRKRESPFEAGSLENALSGMPRPVGAALGNAIADVNAVIGKHNATTEAFQNEIDNVCETLEQCYVAEGFAEYRQLSVAVKEAESALQALVEGPNTLSEEIAVIERKIVEHRRPAEELNAELRSYLGRDELCLEVKESGYNMTRDGQPASHLSEGEKTAIAFLYFLKSLKDKSFDLANGVVVVDDPVSSLDANALFSAFGYMKERTKAAGQLFVLTHNFAFFRQVKNWFHHLPSQNKKDRNLRPGRFYMLSMCVESEGRSASLRPIDPLLEWYESEYHYLFKRVHQEANRGEAEVLLEEYYGMPNVARRLVESFLAFRYPAGSGDLSRKLEHVDFDSGKKTRILRFLHTYSHSGSIADPEHDPSVLAETKSVLRELLELIEKCDP